MYRKSVSANHHRRKIKKHCEIRAHLATTDNVFAHKTRKNIDFCCLSVGVNLSFPSISFHFFAKISANNYLFIRLLSEFAAC